MNKEEAKKKLNRFMDQTSDNSNQQSFVDWRPKAIVYLHPDGDIHERKRYWIPQEIEVEEVVNKNISGTAEKKTTSLVHFELEPGLDESHSLLELHEKLLLTP